MRRFWHYLIGCGPFWTYTDRHVRCCIVCDRHQSNARYGCAWRDA